MGAFSVFEISRTPFLYPVGFTGYIHGYLLVYLDVNRERVPLDAASFQKENLKKVTPIVNDQVQRESSILVSNPIHCFNIVQTPQGAIKYNCLTI